MMSCAPFARSPLICSATTPLAAKGTRISSYVITGFVTSPDSRGGSLVSSPGKEIHFGGHTGPAARGRHHPVLEGFKGIGGRCCRDKRLFSEEPSLAVPCKRLRFEKTRQVRRRLSRSGPLVLCGRVRDDRRH